MHSALFRSIVDAEGIVYMEPKQNTSRGKDRRQVERRKHPREELGSGDSSVERRSGTDRRSSGSDRRKGD